MVENHSEIESPYPDSEDWQAAFDVYEGHATAAFCLAHDLIAVQQYLIGERKKIPAAVASLDAADDTLYEHTQFRSVSHELFRAAVEGRITIEQEQLLRDLGIKI
jgi:hypothetical protein